MDTPDHRTLVVGDIHGAYRALRQVFERSGFDFARDELIVLGDVADGWPEVPECIDELLRVKRRVVLLGNHDEWFMQWVFEEFADPGWLDQGGRATCDAYGGDCLSVPEAHRDYLLSARNYYVDAQNRCFVHGGLSLKYEEHPSDTDGDTLRWSRDFWETAVMIADATPPGEEAALSAFSEVYLGHTPTHRVWTDCRPVRACNVWNLDQGAGWEGKLTIMDVATKQFWQSDVVPRLYPGVEGRY